MHAVNERNNKRTRFSVNEVLISDVTIEDCASPVFVLVQKILVANEKIFLLVKPSKLIFTRKSHAPTAYQLMMRPMDF